MKTAFTFILFMWVSGIAQPNNSTFIFLSDTQQPIWIETLRLNEHDNEKATSIIYRAIEEESTATTIFHLGDITSVGMIDSYWESFDKFQKNIQTPVYPVIGNHDYFIIKKYALKQFHKRFPSLSSLWYSVVSAPVAFIALNSNFSELSDSEKQNQQDWYFNELARFENDSTIKSVIVLCHHSPYTNSTIVSPSDAVQKLFVTPFFMYRKTSVFLSGHAHAYEHFQRGGKEFLVIGGGGGLLQPLLTGSKQRFSDLFENQSPIRFFHFVQCDLQNSGLQFKVKKLRNDFSGFEIVDSLSVPFYR